MTQPDHALEITDDFAALLEHYLGPAIYARWAHRIAEIAEIEIGHEILDVGCGIGTLARAAQLETGLTGKVTGLDSSEKMLAFAQLHSRGIEWQRGDTEKLPFEPDHFDRVLSQFSLMFMVSRVAAIKEMLRVCKPNGKIVLAVWAALEHSWAYCALIKLVEKHAGAAVAFKLSLPWSLGKPDVMNALLTAAGVSRYDCHEHVGQACFPSMASFIDAHLRLAGEFNQLDEAIYQDILGAAKTELQPFMVADGQLIAQLDVNIFTVSDI